MRHNGTAYRRVRAATWLLASLLVFVSCSDNSHDPRQVYGYRDATDSDLLAEIEESIEVANAALAVEGRYELRPTWKSSPKQHSKQSVPVYLLRRSHPTIEAGVARTSKALNAFRAELAKTELPPKFETCAETDPCAALMYAGTKMAMLTAEVYQNMAAVDAAATEIGCRCVMLMEDDWRKFKLIFGPSIQNGRSVVPLTWYVPWYALHEVGHRDISFQPTLGTAWADLYRRTQIGLNTLQQEEMRADAYAASVLGRACFVQPLQEVRHAVAQACYGLVIQNMQLWFYGIFDKTDKGLLRQYLRDGGKHPNTLMRLLAANLVMTNGGDNAVNLLADFMDKREIFVQSLARPSTLRP